MVNPRRTLQRDLDTCIFNVALAANELNHCLEEQWEARLQNLKAQGLHNVQAVMDSLRADTLDVCRAAGYSGPMLAAVQGVIDGFKPVSTSAKVRRFPGNGGAA